MKDKLITIFCILGSLFISVLYLNKPNLSTSDCFIIALNLTSLILNVMALNRDAKK